MVRERLCNAIKRIGISNKSITLIQMTFKNAEHVVRKRRKLSRTYKLQKKM